MKRTDSQYPLECFEKAHSAAIREYCRKNRISPDEVEGVRREGNTTAEYYHNGKLIMTATIAYYVPKVKFKYNRP